jgi:hypothetical protein
MNTKKIFTAFVSLIFITGFYGCNDNGISPYPNTGVQMTFVSSYSPSGSCANSFVKNISGNDYAFLSLGNSGMEIVNVSNPSSPQYVADYNVPGNTEEIFLADINNTSYAFVAAGQGGVLVLDLSGLPLISLVTTLNFSGDYISSVFADNINNILYAGGNNNKVYIEDLANLPVVTNMSTYQSFSQINKIEVKNNVEYIAQDDGLDIVNVINPYAPVRYSHGTSEDYAYDVKISWDYALVANNQNGVLVLDVSNPSNPQELGYLETNDVALACAVNGNMVYVSEDDGGIEVFDISNPSSPVFVAFYPSRAYSENVFYYNGFVYVSDYNNYLILKFP